MNQAPVIRPEPIVFADYEDEKFEQSAVSEKNISTKKMIASQGTLLYLTEQVFYPEQGILMKYKDVPYLRQGFVFPEAMDGVNNIKKIIVFFLSILKGKGIKQKIGFALANLVWIADWMFTWYDPNSQKVRKIYLKDNRYRQSIRELIKLINNFLENLDIKVWTPETHTKDFGRLIGTILEYDNAYYWRMEDIFSETSKELLLKNPRKELSRLLKIYQLREKQHIEFKAEQIIRVLRFLLLIPSVKKAFKKAVESVDIEKMKTTNYKADKDELAINDLYFQMIYQGYEFKGKPLEERMKIWLEMTNGKAPERIYIPIQ